MNGAPMEWGGKCEKGSHALEVGASPKGSQTKRGAALQTPARVKEPGC
jgi:hypothetical protein